MRQKRMIGKWLHSHLDDPVELGVVAALVGGERLRPQHRLGEVALVRPAAAAARRRRRGGRNRRRGRRHARGRRRRRIGRRRRFCTRELGLISDSDALTTNKPPLLNLLHGPSWGHLNISKWQALSLYFRQCTESCQVSLVTLEEAVEPLDVAPLLERVADAVDLLLTEGDVRRGSTLDPVGGRRVGFVGRGRGGRRRVEEVGQVRMGVLQRRVEEALRSKHLGIFHRS